MKLLQELTELGKPKKYLIHFAAEAVCYNTPHYFEIPDEQDSEITFTGNQCDELRDTVLEYWTKNAPRQKHMHALNIQITDVKVTEVSFDVAELIDVARDMHDIEDEDGYDDDEDHEGEPGRVIETYSDTRAVGGSATMPYTMTFTVTAKTALSKDAGHWLADDIGGAVWGQYNDDGGGFRDFEMTEVK